MNEDRRSKRPSTVKKRKQLEEKLEQRKIDAELNVEKSRSEKLLNLHEQELILEHFLNSNFSGIKYVRLKLKI